MLRTVNEYLVIFGTQKGGGDGEEEEDFKAALHAVQSSALSSNVDYFFFPACNVDSKDSENMQSAH